MAKRNLRAGEELDGGGGYTVVGQCEKALVARQEGLLPLGLSDRAVLKRDVVKGEAIGYGDVTLNEDSFVLKMRRFARRINRARVIGESGDVRTNASKNWPVADRAPLLLGAVPQAQVDGSEHVWQLRELLDPLGEVVAPELVDTPQKATEAGEMFLRAEVDLLLVFLSATRRAWICCRQSKGWMYRSDCLTRTRIARMITLRRIRTDYLHHEGVCCIPEFAGRANESRTPFAVRTGSFADERLRQELRADFAGAAAARSFRRLNVGLIGQVYPGMTDMPIDEHRLLRGDGSDAGATGS